MLSEQGFDDTKDARYQNASEHGNACELAKFAKFSVSVSAGISSIEKLTFACAVFLVVAVFLSFGSSHMPNVYKPHDVPHQGSCRLSPLQLQAHPCCNRWFLPNSEPRVGHP